MISSMMQPRFKSSLEKAMGFTRCSVRRFIDHENLSLVFSALLVKK